MEAVKELSYLLFSVCEKKGWTETAILFNALGTSWIDISQPISSSSLPSVQESLDL
jgi:putative DNA methylase